MFIGLDNLSLASRHYRLEALPGQFTDTTSTLQLGWRERMTFHYRVVPLEQESKTCLLSEHAFAEKEITTVKECCVTASADTDYLCLERAAENFEAAWKAHQLELARAQSAHNDGDAQPRSISSIRRANTSDTPDDGSSDDYSLSERIILHPTSIGKLCPPEKSASEVNIVCSWSAIGNSQEEAMIRGEHHKRGLSVRPISKCKGCPIVPTATYDHSVAHDFKQGPAVSVGYCLLILSEGRSTIICLPACLTFCCLLALLFSVRMFRLSPFALLCETAPSPRISLTLNFAWSSIRNHLQEPLNLSVSSV